tara:strand:+ start:782 stop:961 length:180 start_codon:yes stop_codon:yes gene_type:complete
MVGSGKLFFHHPIDISHFLPDAFLVLINFFIIFILLLPFFIVLELIKHLNAILSLVFSF